MDTIWKWLVDGGAMALVVGAMLGVTWYRHHVLRRQVAALAEDVKDLGEQVYRVEMRLERPEWDGEQQ